MDDRRELEERMRVSLHHEAPPALDPDAIMAGARRTRARRRAAVLSGAAGLVLVVGAGAFTVNVLSGTNAAQSSGQAAAPDARQPAPTSADGAPAGDGAPVTLEDGVVASPRGTGFCVRSPRLREPVCHEGPGSVVVAGATRRWLVFGGPVHTNGYKYDRSGTWVAMDWRAASRIAPQAYAYAPDPVGDGPFRVREARTDNPTVWVG